MLIISDEKQKNNILFLTNCPILLSTPAKK